MSLIRQRKKKLLKAGLIGAVIGMIILISILAAIIVIYPGIIGKNKASKDKQYKQVIQLVKPLKAGDIIEAKDLQPVKLLENLVPLDTLTQSEIIGKRLKLSLGERTIITKDFIYSGKAIVNDLRLHNYNFIKLSDKLKAGDYIDVRISFANGADFILLAKKRVEDLSIQTTGESSSSSLWLNLTEEEILRVSSAAVDAYLNEGCTIYAIQYVSELQEEAIINYPVNEVVEQLIAEDPNIITKAENVLKSTLRSQLDLQKASNNNQKSIGNELNSKSEEDNNFSEDLYPQTTSENEEIEYLE